MRGAHLKWVKARKSLEKGAGDRIPQNRALLPTHSDVLFGRGRPYQDHPGNQRVGLMVESLMPRYNGLKKLEKTALCQELVDEIKKSGGRFLKQVSGGVWEVGSDTLAREKISQTFRTTRSVIKKREVVDGGQKKDPNGFRESGHEETGKRVRQD
jgi:hypothetical protein